MVTTRRQQKAEASDDSRETLSPAAKRIASREVEEKHREAHEANKQGTEPGIEFGHRGVEPCQRAPKQALSAFENSTLRSLLATYGSFPFEASTLSEPRIPTPPTLLAHLLNALLSSTRISHAIASKTLGLLIEAGYTNLETLEKSTWEERTEVLTEGGYTHYREKTATELQKMAEWIRRECGADLNTVLHLSKLNGEGAEVKNLVREKMKEIKGFGDVAADIFFDSAQGVWGELAPFLDLRSQKTAERIGLPGNADDLFRILKNSPVDMARLASALTVVRLERREHEFE